MTATFDAIVIGAGANGLVASSVLARGGLKTLLLESQDTLGGQGRAVEFAPGFRAAPLATDPGWLPPAVARAAGIEPPSMRASDAPTTLALGDGSCLTLWRDAARAAQEIRRHSAADADRWPVFVTRLRALTGMLETLYMMPAPDVDVPSSDWLPLLGLARDFRSLGRENMIEFLRVLPMSVAELLDDTFASDALKAAIAPGGIRDHRQGPRSNATGFVLLHYLVGATLGAVRLHGSWAAGDDAATRAAEAAAKRAGVTIRTGAAVARIDVRDDAVAGVTLASGETLAAKRVLSTADPRRTLAEWIDPVWLDPEFLHAVSNIRYRGCTAFVMYAVDGPPDVKGLAPEAQGGVVSLTASLRDLERAADASTPRCPSGLTSSSPCRRCTRRALPRG
jgi:phytoene dehydrogenase-like protein